MTDPVLHDSDICQQCHKVKPDAPALDDLLAAQGRTRDTAGPVICECHRSPVSKRTDGITGMFRKA